MVVKAPVADLIELLLPLGSQLYRELANSDKGEVNSYAVCKDILYHLVGKLDRLSYHWREVKQQHESSFPNVIKASQATEFGKVSDKISIRNIFLSIISQNLNIFQNR